MFALLGLVLYFQLCSLFILIWTLHKLRFLSHQQLAPHAVIYARISTYVSLSYFITVIFVSGCPVSLFLYRNDL